MTPNPSRLPTVRPRPSVLLALLLPVVVAAGAVRAQPGPPAYEARLLIEHNAVDDDTGFQIFFDGDPWAALSVTGPGGAVLDVEALGPMAGYGLTEMFFETNEPAADEMPREEVLALLPEGTYAFAVRSVDGATSTVTATLTHALPVAVEIVAPRDDARVPPDAPLVVRWAGTDAALGGGRVAIAAYRVIVGRELELRDGGGFAEPVFDAVVPPTATRLPVPAEFLRPGTPYEIEVLALEASGNGTIAAAVFETTGTPIDDLAEVAEPGPEELAAAKFLIEHNATDQDTGYQIFLDGEPWRAATVTTPAGEGVVAVTPGGTLAALGLTEMFFETNEPPADETALAEVLALFSEGGYAFAAEGVEGAAPMTGAAALAHAIPQATTIAIPAGPVDAEAPLTVAWSSVAASLEGAPLDVVGYQLIVVKEADGPPTAGSFLPTFSVHVPADTTSVTVPAEFLEAGSSYEIEVLALEGSGNQTISLTTFETTP